VAEARTMAAVTGARARPAGTREQGPARLQPGRALDAAALAAAIPRLDQDADRQAPAPAGEVTDPAAAPGGTAAAVPATTGAPASWRNQ
jgi:hypothetical protein